ncbi:MAG: class I SAM-dependent methyltransferase [Fidelibacterota bacterium]
MLFLHKDKKYEFIRYPKTRNKSLRAWNAADELIIKHLEDENLDDKKIILYHDRFGFLNTMFRDYQPLSMISYKSQEKAIIQNREINQLPTDDLQFMDLFSRPKLKMDLAIIKQPKSLDLFQYYLQHLSKKIKKQGTVICGFMTRHFSKSMLELANEYFEEAVQTKAWKKSRLLIMKKPKPFKERDLIREIPYKDDVVRHYPGIFSAGKIDPATSFLIDHLDLQVRDKIILDLGCGNGILTQAMTAMKNNADYHLIDDFFLAVESAKLNLKGKNFHFYYDDNLKIFDNHTFDFVVSNPPFHFEYENNIEVSLELFQHVARILTENGRFQMVANKHLNYLTHLEKYFNEVTVMDENEKYIIYECFNRPDNEEKDIEDIQFNV